MPSLTVFSLLSGHSVTAASLVSVTEINRASPGHVGLGQKLVSVTFCNPLISTMLACLAVVPVSLSCSANYLSRTLLCCTLGTGRILSHQSQLSCRTSGSFVAQFACVHRWESAETLLTCRAGSFSLLLSPLLRNSITSPTP